MRRRLLDRIRSEERASSRGAGSSDARALLFLLLAVLLFGSPALAQSRDDGFVATLGELREASYPDKAKIVDRLSESGHPSADAVLTAFLEDRLYFRTADQKIFIVKSADDALTSLQLIDPLTLKCGNYNTKTKVCSGQNYK